MSFFYNDTDKWCHKCYYLEKHDTKNITDGHVNSALIVIWRDWDKILEFEPKWYIHIICKSRWDKRFTFRYKT